MQKIFCFFLLLLRLYLFALSRLTRSYSFQEIDLCRELDTNINSYRIISTNVFQWKCDKLLFIVEWMKNCANHKKFTQKYCLLLGLAAKFVLPFKIRKWCAHNLYTRTFAFIRKRKKKINLIEISSHTKEIRINLNMLDSVHVKWPLSR